MTPHPISVSDAIAAHRIALAADEAAFGQDYKPVDEALAAETLKAEEAAFKAFALAPCYSASDVQAKIDYILNGNVGERDKLIDCLGSEPYGGLEVQDGFIRSLLLPLLMHTREED